MIQKGSIGNTVIEKCAPIREEKVQKGTIGKEVQRDYSKTEGIETSEID
jgi:hypothetical protein